jgi:glycosyltransferase involved in cell wall biosynthesis
MNAPLVSVITPCYNQEHYISRCIESVLSQRYTHWEQIIVDDGSSDGTADVVRRYDDPRIRYIRLPHRGLSALAETYNTALSVARGELVGILEGDDLWPAGKLEAQVPLFRDESTFLSWGRGELIDEDGNRCGERASILTTRERLYFSSRDVFRRLTHNNFLTPTVTVMVRRTALDRIGGFKQTGSSLFVDLPTWLWTAANTSGRACYLNEVLGRYRIYPRQTSQQHKARMDSEHLRVVMEIEHTLDASTLKEAGWDAGLRERAMLGSLLIEGIAHLDDRRFRAAAGSFRRALLRASTPADRAKAALGLVSAAARFNLLAAAFSMREYAAATIRPARSRNASPDEDPARG